MSDSVFLDNLRAFGLTGQEALVYETLLRHGAMTGYEVAKETGISRSNAYGSLSSLADKGAAYVLEGESTKYIPESIEIFTGNVLKDISGKAKWLLENAPKPADTSEGFITVAGTANIENKIDNMLSKCELRLYFQAGSDILEKYRPTLEKIVSDGKKVVMITDDFDIEGATVYRGDHDKGQIRLITDSSYVLTGTLNYKDDDKCLYSGQSDFVKVMKEALKNKILLIQHGIEEEERE